MNEEWARFEREIIDQKTTSRKSLYWGIGIAASIALLAGIFLLNNDAEKQQGIAQQTTHTTETPSAADEPVALPEKDESVRIETEQWPQTELSAQATFPSTAEKGFSSQGLIGSTGDSIPILFVSKKGRKSLPYLWERDAVLTVVNGKVDADLMQYISEMPYWSMADVYDYFFEKNYCCPIKVFFTE